MADSVFPSGKLPSRFLVFKEAIDRASARRKIPAWVLWGLVFKESSGDPNLKVGKDGNGYGPFQIDIGSHKEWLATHDPNNLMDAADYAAKIIKDNLKETGGNLEHAIAAYNAGATAVNRKLNKGMTLDQITHKPNYVGDVTRSGKEIVGHLYPEAKKAEGVYPPAPPPADWKSIVADDPRVYGPPRDVPYGPPRAGLGFNTNPLLMAFEAMKAAAPVGKADSRGEFLDTGSEAVGTPERPALEPSRIDHYFRVGRGDPDEPVEATSTESFYQVPPDEDFVKPTSTSMTFEPGKKEPSTTEYYYQIQGKRRK